MSDEMLIIVVLGGAIGGIAGVAYLLDRRNRSSGTSQSMAPEPGSAGYVLMWATRVLVAMMVLLLIAFFVFRSFVFLWIAGGCVLVAMVVGQIRRIIRLGGM